MFAMVLCKCRHDSIFLRPSQLIYAFYWCTGYDTINVMDSFLVNFSLLTFISVVLVVVMSVVIHEVAHGYTAYLFGDRTALAAGRLTLNPTPHIDFVGSVLVPVGAMLLAGSAFGWAKPVPVDERHLKTKRQRFLVSAAGILANLFIAMLAFFAIKFGAGNGAVSSEGVKLITLILVTNMSLAIFNLIPIPPFDGMAMLQSLFPKLQFDSRVIYNPIYMIVAILGASFIFNLILPSVLTSIAKLI